MGISRITGISQADSVFLESLVNSLPAGTGGANKRMTPDNVEDFMNNIDNFAVSVDMDLQRRSVSAASAVEKFISENCPYFTVEDDHLGARFYVIHNITIGRLPHNDIQLTDSSVSRLHCRVFSRGGRYYCVDMTPGENENNKAVLDGVPVNNGHPCNTRELFAHMLKNGSRLTVGRTTLIFHIKTPADKAYTEELQACDSSVTLK